MPAKAFCFAGRRDAGGSSGHRKTPSGRGAPCPRTQPARGLSHGFQQWRRRRPIRLSSASSLARWAAVPLATGVITSSMNSPSRPFSESNDRTVLSIVASLPPVPRPAGDLKTQVKGLESFIHNGERRGDRLLWRGG